MRVIKCTSCGFAASRELPRCPACRQKSLVFCHTFNTSGEIYYQMMRTSPVSGSHPLLSLAAVIAFTLGATYLAHSWMFPGNSVTEELPKVIASLTHSK